MSMKMSMKMIDIFLVLSEAIIDGDENAGIAETRKLIENGTSPVDIFAECVEPTLNALGERFARLDIFLPDLMVAGNVVKAIQDEVAPLIDSVEEAGMHKGKAVICTVCGDMHDIGKNMVSLMMEVNGFEMYDMGVDVRTVDIVDKAIEVEADLVCLSGLMMPSMPFMRETIELVKKNPKLTAKTKVMIGGGPVTEQWAEKNGADGYANDATEAVKLAFELIAK